MKRAYIIGSSISGLLAAAALAKRYESVTVIERDDTPSAPEPRRGVPQGKHTHVLLQAGEHILEELLPGTRAALVAAGGHSLDFGRDVAWFHHGVWKQRHVSGFSFHTASRPLLEHVVSTRVAALKNVTIRRGEAVEGLALNAERTRVIGVRIKGQIEQADLVLDAAGRGTQSARWLEALGFAPPPETRMHPNLRYATRVYRVPAEATVPWRALLVYPDPPAQTRAGLIFPLEGNRWIVTLAGWCGDHPPADVDGFEAYIESLPHPELQRALQHAVPLTEPTLHPFPEALWRRWDRVRRMPKGLLIVGDAACSFDPVFGQGMTSAAKQVHLLGRYLDFDPRVEKPHWFFKAQAFVIATPWLLSTSEDFRYPQVEGERLPFLPLLQAYTKQVFKLCATDVDVYRRFLRVMHLVDSPHVLFAPSVIQKVLRNRAPNPGAPSSAPLPLIPGEQMRPGVPRVGDFPQVADT